MGLLSRRHLVQNLLAAVSVGTLCVGCTGSVPKTAIPRGMVVYNVKGYSAVGDGATDDSGPVQAAINAAQSAGGGIVYFPQGRYNCNRDLAYDFNSRDNRGSLTFQGDGLDTSVLHLNGANLVDGHFDDWNTGYTHLNVRDLTVRFTGMESGSQAATGCWDAPTTLPLLQHVTLWVDGRYPDNTTVLLGRGSGPVGRTATWDNVSLQLEPSSGDSLLLLRAHFDTFRWDGGSIYTNFGRSCADPRLIFLDAVYTYEIRSLSTFRSDTIPAQLFWVGSEEDDSEIVIESIILPENCTCHFRNINNAKAPVIRVKSCTNLGNWPLIAVANTGYPVPKVTYDGVASYPTTSHGTATIAAGASSVTLSHGLPGTPLGVFLTPMSNPRQHYWVSDLTDNQFIINLGAAATVPTPFSWRATLDTGS